MSRSTERTFLVDVGTVVTVYITMVLAVGSEDYIGLG